MKRHHIAFTLILVGAFGYGQTNAPNTGTHLAGGGRQGPFPKSTPEQYRQSLIAWWMTFTSPMQGGDETLAGMGDEAAADVLNILSARSPLSAPEMQTAMDIVHKAFARPRAIQVVANRKPTAALALIQQIQAAATDQLVKERIGIEINFLSAVPQVLPPLTLPANVPEGPNPFPGQHQIVQGTPAH